MDIGTFLDGRSLSYDESTGSFAIGDVRVTADEIRTLLESGQVSWQSPETGTWFETSFPPPASIASVSARPKAPKKKRGLIIALVVAAVILAAGIAVAVVALRANKPDATAEMKASIPSLEFIDPSSLPQGTKVEAGTKLAPGSYRAFMTGERIQTVQWFQNANNSDESDLRLTLDAEGTRLFGQQTSQNVNKLIPLAVDGRIIEAVFVGQPVLDGRLVISGPQMKDLRAILDPEIVVASRKPSPATAATKPEEGAQDLGSLGSKHATNATTKNGLLVWVPQDWSIYENDSGYFVMVPNQFEWISIGSTPVSLVVVLNPPNETPSQYNETVGGTTVSGPQDVRWLGASGLMWTHVKVHGHTVTLARLEGEDGFHVEWLFSAESRLYDEYRGTADDILASIRRAE